MKLAMDTVLVGVRHAIFPGLERMQWEVPDHLMDEAQQFHDRDEAVKLSETRGPLADWLRERAREHQDVNVACLVRGGRYSREQIH